MTLLILATVVCFGFVIFFGAPYLPTLSKQQKIALDLLNLKPGQTLLELGSGDGRVMRMAAARGLNVVGYEINPILVVISYFVTFKYRKNVRIIWANYWQAKWPDHDAIFTFLLDKYMKKLDKAVMKKSKKGVNLASIAFKIPGKNPVQEKNGVLIYDY